MRSEWKEEQLSSICRYRSERISVSGLTIKNYISTVNMLPEKAGIENIDSLPNVNTTSRFYKNDVLVSNIRPYFKKVWLAEFDGGCSNDVLVFSVFEGVSSKYLYYLISDNIFFDYMMSTAKGTKMPRGDKNAIMLYDIKNPPLPTQRAIADTLSCLDAKIELNNKINANLEAQAQAIFKSWFVDFEPFKDGEFVESELGLIPKGWEVVRLDEIATFLNGLAMQKFPPKDNETGIPVLKIKELRQGYTDNNSDRCSKDIANEYHIDNGDVIFSWSGSLLVDIWTGGLAGLNQHLFKVNSTKYDKWFYYMWTKQHLDKFVEIAKERRTTMGHIKRSHLSESLVLIPQENDYKKISKLMEPIVEKKTLNMLENTTLATLRDLLLPKLMSGEIEVPTETH